MISDKSIKLAVNCLMQPFSIFIRSLDKHMAVLYVITMTIKRLCYLSKLKDLHLLLQKAHFSPNMAGTLSTFTVSSKTGTKKQIAVNKQKKNYGLQLQTIKKETDWLKVEKAWSIQNHMMIASLKECSMSMVVLRAYLLNLST